MHAPQRKIIRDVVTPHGRRRIMRMKAGRRTNTVHRSFRKEVRQWLAITCSVQTAAHGSFSFWSFPAYSETAFAAETTTAAVAKETFQTTTADAAADGGTPVRVMKKRWFSLLMQRKPPCNAAVSAVMRIIFLKSVYIMFKRFLSSQNRVLKRFRSFLRLIFPAMITA